MIFESPLKWLQQQPRTKSPVMARFQTKSPSKAGDNLINELKRLGAKSCVISSNMQIKKTGGFFAKQRVDDAGVVVYFQLKGKSKAMACDRWSKVEHNLWALYLSVSAIRGLDRWGGSEFLDGLFDGFKALPSPDDIIEMEKQYFTGCYSEIEIKKKYRELIKKYHPDVNNGNDLEFKVIQKQYNQLVR